MCEICHQIPCVPGCPNYERPHKTGERCYFCNDYICVGDDYIVNWLGMAAHYQCMSSTKDELEWLGYEVKTMDE